MFPVSGVITKCHWEFETEKWEEPERMETVIFLFTGAIVQLFGNNPGKPLV